MSKSIILIETPQRCSMCKFLNGTENGYHYCHMLDFDYQVDEYMQSTPKGKPDWCPLKEVPDKKKEKQYMKRLNSNRNIETYGERTDLCAVGWNDCIDEILKERD